MRGLKNTKILPTRAISGLLVVLLMLVSSTSLSSAASSGGGASGLSISPLREQLTMVPSETQQFQVTLKNITATTIVAEPVVRDFTSDNVDGNPKIITTPNYSSPVSIKNFIVGLNKLTLAVNQQKTFNITVRVPDNASPGAYYGIIEWQAVPSNANGTPTGNNKVALTAAVGQLVFITVPGTVVTRVQVNAIQVYHDKLGTDAGLFFTSHPKSVGVSIGNGGNAFETPYGTVTIQNFSGKTVDTYQLNNADVRGIVLPDSSRIFVNQIKGISTPGPYTVTASVSYGSGGSAILIAKKTFWYLPWWLVAIIVIILAIIIGGIWLARRHYKQPSGKYYRR